MVSYRRTHKTSRCRSNRRAHKSAWRAVLSALGLSGCRDSRSRRHRRDPWCSPIEFWRRAVEFDISGLHPLTLASPVYTAAHGRSVMRVKAHGTGGPRQPVHGARQCIRNKKNLCSRHVSRRFAARRQTEGHPSDVSTRQWEVRGEAPAFAQRASLFCEHIRTAIRPLEHNFRAPKKHGSLQRQPGECFERQRPRTKKPTSDDGCRDGQKVPSFFRSWLIAALNTNGCYEGRDSVPRRRPPLLLR